MARNSAAKTVAPAADREVTTGHNQPPVVVNLGDTVKQVLQGESQQENRQLSIAYAIHMEADKYRTESLITLLKEPGKSIELNKTHGFPDSIKKLNVVELFFCAASADYRAAIVDAKTWKQKQAQVKAESRKLSIMLDGKKSELLLKASSQKFKRALYCALALRMGDFRQLEINTDKGVLEGFQHKDYDDNGRLIVFVPSEENPKEPEPTLGHFSGNTLEKMGRNIIEGIKNPPPPPGSEAEEKEGNGTNDNEETPQQKKAKLDAQKKRLTDAATEVYAMGKEQAAQVHEEADKVMIALLQNVYSEEGKGGVKVIVIEELEQYIRLLFKGNKYVSVVHSFTQAIGPDNKAIKPETSRLAPKLKALEELAAKQPEAPKPDLRDNAPKNGNGKDKKTKETAPTA